jgi:hypothetical protein
MSNKIKVCPECGHWYGNHSLGCPENPDCDEDRDGEDEIESEPLEKEPDYDAPKALSPLDNYARNHWRNVP